MPDADSRHLDFKDFRISKPLTTFNIRPPAYQNQHFKRTPMGMEPDAQELLVKVSKSLATGLLWLIINMTFGIFFGWFFWGDHLALGNYIFYAFLIISLVVLVWYQFKVWK